MHGCTCLHQLISFHHLWSLLGCPAAHTRSTAAGPTEATRLPKRPRFKTQHTFAPLPRGHASLATASFKPASHRTVRSLFGTASLPSRHHVQQLRHLRPLEPRDGVQRRISGLAKRGPRTRPQTILRDHETKLVPGRLMSHAGYECSALQDFKRHPPALSAPR